jgi:hypothetical protein
MCSYERTVKQKFALFDFSEAKVAEQVQQSTAYTASKGAEVGLRLEEKASTPKKRAKGKAKATVADPAAPSSTTSKTASPQKKSKKKNEVKTSESQQSAQETESKTTNVLGALYNSAYIMTQLDAAKHALRNARTTMLQMGDDEFPGGGVRQRLLDIVEFARVTAVLTDVETAKEFLKKENGVGESKAGEESESWAVSAQGAGEARPDGEEVGSNGVNGEGVQVSGVAMNGEGAVDAQKTQERATNGDVESEAETEVDEAKMELEQKGKKEVGKVQIEDGED